MNFQRTETFIAEQHLIWYFYLNQKNTFIHFLEEKKHTAINSGFRWLLIFSRSSKINLEVNNKIPLSRSFKGTILAKAVNPFGESFGDQLINSIRAHQDFFVLLKLRE